VTTEHGQLVFGGGGYDWCGYPDITSIMQPGSNTIILETKNTQYENTGVYETWMNVVPPTSGIKARQQYVQELEFPNKTVKTSINGNNLL
jgi:hypothetical protein